MPTTPSLHAWPTGRSTRRYRLDDEGHTLWLDVPDPRLLADHWAEPMLAETDTWGRRGRTILRRSPGEPEPRPAPLDDLVDVLAVALAALPEVEGASRPYECLRILLRRPASRAHGDFLASLGRATRDALPAAPRPVAERPPARPARELRAASRERLHRDEQETSLWALRIWSDGAEPGRVTPPALFEVAADLIEDLVDEYDDETDGYRRDGLPVAEEWAEYAEDNGYPIRPRRVGPRVFRGVAVGSFGEPRMIMGTRAYVITRDHLDRLRGASDLTEQTTTYEKEAV